MASLIRSLQTLSLTCLFVISIAAQTASQTSDTTQRAELNITVGEARIKFTPTRPFQVMQLNVFNSQGELVFTHLTATAELLWSVQNNNDEPLVPGLYAYVLTLKYADQDERQHKGHFIIEKTRDQLWLTTKDGDDVSGETLTAARTGDRTVAGTRTDPTSQPNANRDVSGRDLVDETANQLVDRKAASPNAPKALLGTPYRIVKYDVNGNLSVDSAIRENSTGTRLGFGINTGAAPFLVNGDMDASFAPNTPVFILQSDQVDHARIEMRSAGPALAHAPILQGRASAGSLSSPQATPADQILGGFGGGGHDGTPGGPFSILSSGFIGIRAGELYTPTKQGSYIRFETTQNGTISRTEKMRITGDGKIGVGVVVPNNPTVLTNFLNGSTKLHVLGGSNTAVYGETSGGPAAYGVWGVSTASGGYGVYGFSDFNGVNAYGVFGQARGNGVAVQGNLAFPEQDGYAGYFNGRTHVNGNLSKSSGSFKIDHPLDPANKYLYHSFVESPDMMNIYNGNVTTDQQGLASITLPDYFEAINREFRYQLTVIGKFAQAIVSEEINGNQFRIQTDQPYTKVSWMVTGVRQDAYAKAHRIPNTELKPEAERGSYLHPGLFGQPEEKSVEWVRQPEMMKRLKEQREKAEKEKKSN